MRVITYALGKVTVWNKKENAIKFFKVHKNSYNDFDEKIKNSDKRFFTERELLSNEDKEHIVKCVFEFNENISAAWEILKDMETSRFTEMLPVLAFDR